MVRKCRECALILILLLAGSFSAALADDFRFVSAEFVALRTQSEIEWPLSRLRPTKALIMATLSADVDLRKYTRRYSYNIVNHAGVCRDGNVDSSTESHLFPRIYDAFGEINQSLWSPDSSPTADNSSAYLYHVYILVELEEPGMPPKTDRSHALLYDLRTRPEDVCIQLRGGSMIGMRFLSNIVVVPKEDIARAISQSRFPLQ